MGVSSYLNVDFFGFFFLGNFRAVGLKYIKIIKGIT